MSRPGRWKAGLLGILPDLIQKRAATTSEAAYRSRFLAQLRRLEGDARSAWLAAFDKLRRAPSASALLAAVEAEDAAALDKLFKLSQLGEVLTNPKAAGRPMAFADLSRRAVFSTAEQVADRLKAQLKAPVEASFMQKRGEKWLKQHGAEFVRGVTAEAKGAIRAILAESATIGPARTVNLLRQNIDLTEGWARAVARYQSELLEAGATPESAARYAKEYAERLRTRRAQNIASTEMHRAAREAESGMIEESVANGLIDPEVYEEEWVAIVGDGKVCKICYGAHGSRKPIGGTYPNGKTRAEGHATGCRCASKLVRKDEPAPSVPAFVAPARGGSLRPITPAEAAAASS
jgi:hypothetical protein